jgi:hypothetical protein
VKERKKMQLDHIIMKNTNTNEREKQMGKEVG